MTETPRFKKQCTSSRRGGYQKKHVYFSSLRFLQTIFYFYFFSYKNFGSFVSSENLGFSSLEIQEFYTNF